MTASARAVTYKSLLHQMTQTTPTVLWNDSAAIDELTASIEDGAVGATCNPVIAASILKKEMATWRPRIEALLVEMPGKRGHDLTWRRLLRLWLTTGSRRHIGRGSDAAPQRPLQLSCDPGWPKAGMAEGEAEQLLLDLERDLVGHVVADARAVAGCRRRSAPNP